MDYGAKPSGPVIKKASGAQPAAAPQKKGIHDMLDDIEDMNLED